MVKGSQRTWPWCEIVMPMTFRRFWSSAAPSKPYNPRSIFIKPGTLLKECQSTRPCPMLGLYIHIQGVKKLSNMTQDVFDGNWKRWRLTSGHPTCVSLLESTRTTMPTRAIPQPIYTDNNPSYGNQGIPRERPLRLESALRQQH